MTTLNHARLSLRRRVNREAWEDEREVKLEPLWLPIGWGNYAELTIPELLFCHTGYFYWAFCNNRFHGRMEHQARIVDSRSKHILPPRPNPLQWEFLVKLGNGGLFENFGVVRKELGIPKHGDGFVRVKHLDVSIVSQSDRLTQQKLMKKIKEKFFDKPELTRWDYQQFFDCDENFDLNCREIHCPRIPRRARAQ